MYSNSDNHLISTGFVDPYLFAVLYLRQAEVHSSLAISENEQKGHIQQMLHNKSPLIGPSSLLTDCITMIHIFTVMHLKDHWKPEERREANKALLYSSQGWQFDHRSTECLCQ